jgi:NAD(P)-dependent dehydrogenase (short-subunit alcohol dehydrogenase family)
LEYDMKRLNGKIALISGGTTGMGAATALLFQAEGATVIVTGSNPETLAAARRDLEDIEVIASDAGDAVATKKLVAEMKKRHGRIDVLFVNAGVAKMAPAQMVDEAFFDFQFNVNTRGAYFLIKETAQVMPDGGSIVLTSSIAHAKGMAGLSVYSGSKAALRSFARTFAAELAPRNIRVNVISPGPIDTPIMGKMGMPADQMAAMREQFTAKIPLKRMGRSDEIATVALFFASSDSSFITGADLPVDGGMLDLG